MKETPRNYTDEIHGRSAAICWCCRKHSKPVKATHGEPDLFELPRGWTQAPYPNDFKHPDGSTGSTYRCPECTAAIHRAARADNRAVFRSA